MKVDPSLVSMQSCRLHDKKALYFETYTTFNSTNHLGLIRRSASARIKCQTFSVAIVERNSYFLVSAP